jgi:hypothetical protein
VACIPGCAPLCFARCGPRSDLSLSIHHTTEFAATSEETIQTIAAELATSDRKFRLFKAVYSGGNKPKTAAELSTKTHLSEIGVLQLGTPMAHKLYFEHLKYKGRVAFKKYRHINAVRHRILRLAKNTKLLERHVSSRTPKQTVSIKVGERRNKIQVREIFIEDVVEFKRIKSISAATMQLVYPKRLPEKIFKYGVASILGNKGSFRTGVENETTFSAPLSQSLDDEEQLHLPSRDLPPSLR